MSATAYQDGYHDGESEAQRECNAEIVRLRAERDVAMSVVASSTNRLVEAEERAEAAEAERDRLRDALILAESYSAQMGVLTVEAIRAALKGDTP